MATIGKAAAVADLGFAKLAGYFAWLAWAIIHVLFLIGFKNRVIVMVQWAWGYFSQDRGSRLIHGMVHEREAEPPVLPSRRAELPGPAPAEPQLGPSRAPPAATASRSG